MDLPLRVIQITRKAPIGLSPVGQPTNEHCTKICAPIIPIPASFHGAYPVSPGSIIPPFHYSIFRFPLLTSLPFVKKILPFAPLLTPLPHVYSRFSVPRSYAPAVFPPASFHYSTIPSFQSFHLPLKAYQAF